MNRLHVKYYDVPNRFCHGTFDTLSIYVCLQVLLSHMKYPVVPRRITISKRLAQCMHPALPSGVHLKALETYDIIFKCMGTNRLSQELFIYSAGKETFY